MPRDIADPERGHYNNTNRAFLQRLMAQGAMTFKEGQEVLAHIFTVNDGGRLTRPEDVSQEDFKSYISAASDALSPLDYKIATTQDQKTKARVWAFVNTISDAPSRMATTRTPEEMFYIKRLLDGMFDTYNTKRREIMAINSMQALESKVRKGDRRATVGEEGTQSQAPDRGLTSEQAEKTLAGLVNEKWLERSRAGYYRLTPRGLMELRSWLFDTYNEEAEDPDEWQRIKTCVACKDIVTVGQRCANLECNIRLHNICQDAFWASKPSKHCPKCRAEWNDKKYVGELVVTTSDDYLKGKRRSGGAGSKRSRTQVEAEPEEEEAEQNGGNEEDAEGEDIEEDAPGEIEEEEEEEEEQESSPDVRRKRARPSANQQQDSDQDDSDE